MSVVTPTLLPRRPRFPILLPDLHKPYPVPLPRQVQNYGNLNSYRLLQQEMDDLSEEENELEDIKETIRARGYSFYIPIGKTSTVQEERNDAEDDVEESGSEQSGNPPSVIEDDGENESNQDIDASMEDLDEEDDDEEQDEELSSEI